MDWWMILATVLLICIGLMMIYSTVQDTGSTQITKQIVAFGIGIILVFLLVFLDYRVFSHNAYLIYTLSLGLLIFVLFLGQNIRGMKGWFDFGFFQFQPSEFAKIALIIALAKYFSKRQGRPHHIKDIAISGALTLGMCGLIVLEPDFGSALVLCGVWLFMLLFFGIKKIHGFLLGLALIIFGFMSWKFFLADYQKERIFSFLRPEGSLKDASWNMIQSKVAIGSGGLLGRGLGHGPQSQLAFLPEQHSDFIFASIAEELGFLGGILILGLFLFLIIRIIRVMKLSRNEFGLMLCAGGAFLFTLQIFISIGMNTGLLPVVGIPLPLVSYGGSSLVFSLIILGLVQSVMARHKGLRFEV